jgi:uncharacterized membrane protein YgcG
LIDAVKIIISKHTPEKQPQSNRKATAKQPQRSTMTFFDLFLFTILLIIFTGHMMAWIMSFFYSPPVNRDNRGNYVNPYRLVPRKETEEYKRYERQQYLDSLRR